MLFKDALGGVVRDLRTNKQLALREVAGDLISFNYLSEIERGKKEPSSSVLKIIANGLGVEAHDLIIEAGYRMAEAKVAVPDTAESLFVRSDNWFRQYEDLSL